MRKLRLLLGGSPCTHWSIAQNKNRETEPKGLGWELFKNFLIAKEKFKPDYFLYENNKSMAKAIRDQIDIEFNRPYRESPDWELIWEQASDKGHTVRWTWRNKATGKTEYITRILINSALVSAQNRQRYYWTNIPGVEQPADRGILLTDVLDSGFPYSRLSKEKGYCLDANYWKTPGSPETFLEKKHARDSRTMIAEPVCVAQRGIYSDTMSRSKKTDGDIAQIYEAREDQKTNALTTVQKDNMIAEPIRIGTIENEASGSHDSKQYRAYSPEGKATTLCGQGGGLGAKTGLYAVPIDYKPHKDSDIIITDENMRCQRRDKKHSTIQGTHVTMPNAKTQTVSTSHIPMTFDAVPLNDINGNARTIRATCYKGGIRNPIGNNVDKRTCVAEAWDGKTYPVYTVANGLITIKNKQYPIKLPDGYYIIRKLTVKECMRLQTVRDDYIFPVSNTKAYKMLGNGWTVDVIAHILSHIPHLQDYELEVLSVYDGMSCGNLALEKLGCKIARYVSYEIDKWAIETTQANFPFVEQRGDAFQIREHDWKY